jgi:hypothetical protein
MDKLKSWVNQDATVRGVYVTTRTTYSSVTGDLTSDATVMIACGDSRYPYQARSLDRETAIEKAVAYAVSGLHDRGLDAENSLTCLDCE